jgi:hypothetical protein
MTDTERLAMLLHKLAVGCVYDYGLAPHSEGHRVHAARLIGAGVGHPAEPDALQEALLDAIEDSDASVYPDGIDWPRISDSAHALRAARSRSK